MSAYFTPALFTSLRQLKRHNTREWFLAHRDRYLADVEAPTLRFIQDLAPKMATISRAVVVDPKRSGGSMFRIYRDTRFSADKTPYKTHVAAMFAHKARSKGVGGPGFYLHLEPGDCLGGGGMYHPDTPTLTRVRLAMVENSRAWTRVRKAGLDIQGDRLTRAPAGFDPAHRFIDDLRRKDLYALVAFTERDVIGNDFLERYVEACRRVAPLVAFLARALDWPW